MEEAISILDILAFLSPFLLAGLAGLGWLYKHEREKRTNIEKTLSEKKYAVYMKIMDLFFALISNAQNGNKDKPYDNTTIVEINKDILIYGSDEVIQIFYEWTQAARIKQNSLTYLAKIMIAIRKDMGFPKTKITEKDFLKHMIIDYKQAENDGIV
ncbi:MAG: hypothetical protein PQJ59_05865 [Spirochaetales bacterium]|nr:hypothetical protein [Spirochaetales bacterium]